MAQWLGFPLPNFGGSGPGFESSEMTKLVIMTRLIIVPFFVIPFWVSWRMASNMWRRRLASRLSCDSSRKSQLSPLSQTPLDARDACHRASSVQHHSISITDHLLSLDAGASCDINHEGYYWRRRRRGGVVLSPAFCFYHQK